MRAYVLKHYGGPEGSRLMNVPAPTPGPRDILVKVRAAGLNPVDFKFRQGKLRAILRPKLPFVLGNELAGEVIAVGSDVKRFRWVTVCLPGSQRIVLAHSQSKHVSTRITLRICPAIWISRLPRPYRWRG
jgi:NADPH:quinone reductase-like Zn-dependent oxidoreductase